MDFGYLNSQVCWFQLTLVLKDGDSNTGNLCLFLHWYEANLFHYKIITLHIITIAFLFSDHQTHADIDFCFLLSPNIDIDFGYRWSLIQILTFVTSWHLTHIYSFGNHWPFYKCKYYMYTYTLTNIIYVLLFICRSYLKWILIKMWL